MTGRRFALFLDLSLALADPRERSLLFKVNAASLTNGGFRQSVFYRDIIGLTKIMESAGIVNGNQRCYALSKCCYFPGVIDSQQRPFLIILLCEMDAASRSVA